jgi:hypothetical protein
MGKMKQPLVTLLLSMACVPLVFAFSGRKTTWGDAHVGRGSEQTNCHVKCSKKVKKAGPPPPAHGYGAKYAHRYYPSGRVHFDPSREIYYYFEEDCWCESASLPKDIGLKLSHYVTVETDDDRP